MTTIDPASDGYSEQAGYRVRMPSDLHAAVKAEAKAAGMSMNTWIVRQLQAVVAFPPVPATNGPSDGDPGTFEATVGFTVGGPDPDLLALRLLDQFENMVNLAGTAVSGRVARVEPLARRAG